MKREWILAAMIATIAGCSRVTPAPAMPLPPPAPPAQPAPPTSPAIATHPVVEPIKRIEKAFSHASNKALAYAGSPRIDPDTMAEMRDLYIEAGRALRTLKKHRRGTDYGAAREAINALSDYVNAHPPIPSEGSGPYAIQPK